jgi:hypothetical protein
MLFHFYLLENQVISLFGDQQIVAACSALVRAFAAGPLHTAAVTAAVHYLGYDDFKFGVLHQFVFLGKDIEAEFKRIDNNARQGADHHSHLQYPAGLVLGGNIVKLLKQTLNERNFVHGGLLSV